MGRISVSVETGFWTIWNTLVRPLALYGKVHIGRTKELSKLSKRETFKLREFDDMGTPEQKL